MRAQVEEEGVQAKCQALCPVIPVESRFINGTFIEREPSLGYYLCKYVVEQAKEG